MLLGTDSLDAAAVLAAASHYRLGSPPTSEYAPPHPSPQHTHTPPPPHTHTPRGGGEREVLTRRYSPAEDALLGLTPRDFECALTPPPSPLLHMEGSGTPSRTW